TLFVILPRPPPTSPLFPYTTLFRSYSHAANVSGEIRPPDSRHWSAHALQPPPPTRLAPRKIRHSQRHRYELGLAAAHGRVRTDRSEEHTSELQSRGHLVCRLLLEKK